MRKLRLTIIVTGGRGYRDRRFAFAVLDRLHARFGVAEVIQGKCPYGGADALAEEWAGLHAADGVRSTPMPADFHGRGRAAGPIRNSDMLRVLQSRQHPRGVVAFPGGRGTADMVRKARDGGEVVWAPRPKGLSPQHAGR